MATLVLATFLVQACMSRAWRDLKQPLSARTLFCLLIAFWTLSQLPRVERAPGWQWDCSADTPQQTFSRNNLPDLTPNPSLMLRNGLISVFFYMLVCCWFEKSHSIRASLRSSVSGLLEASLGCHRGCCRHQPALLADGVWPRLAQCRGLQFGCNTTSREALDELA